MTFIAPWQVSQYIEFPIAKRLFTQATFVLNSNTLFRISHKSAFTLLITSVLFTLDYCLLIIVKRTPPNHFHKLLDT